MSLYGSSRDADTGDIEAAIQRVDTYNCCYDIHNRDEHKHIIPAMVMQHRDMALIEVL